MNGRLAALLFAAFAVACTEHSERTAFQVGEHRIEVMVPAGWQALDHGRQLKIRHEERELILLDLGAVRPEGFRAETEAARALWRSGRDDEARTRLWELPLRELASAVLSAPRGTPYDKVAGDFDRLFATIAAMKPAPIEEIVEDALPRLGHEEHRREVKSRQVTKVDGREAMEVATWMTLTHSDPRCLMVAVNGGRALALRSDRCDGVEAEAFEEVLLSLHFTDASRKKIACVPGRVLCPIAQT